MELDDVRDSNAALGRSLGARAQVAAVRIVAAHLRLSDKVFRYDASKFLIRLSGTDLEPGKTVISGSATRSRAGCGRSVTTARPFT